MKTESKSPNALLDHSKSRTKEVVKKIREAMAAIELDIEQNEGIYPFNGGRLTRAEVCRRAGVHKITLQGAAHRATTREMIEVWLKKVKEKMVIGKRAVRKAVTVRADDWHARYLKAAQMTNLYHIQFVSLNDLVAKRGARISELEGQLVQLQAELSKGKIVRMSNRRK